jgi:type I restriction enzyme S subunit
MPKVNRAALSRIRFALPPIAEQMQIVRFVRSEVNRIDALARVASDTMRVLREYRTALVSAAVTGQVDVRTYRKEPEAVLETA